jgi:hypothetical protein
VTVGDDNPGEAFEVFKEFPWVEAYLTGNTHGIWANKNRGIRYFLELTKCKNLVLSDNDIEFKRPGVLSLLEKAAENNQQTHITAYVIDSDGRDGLQATFPSEAMSEDRLLRWHPGCHGCFLWFSRDIVKKIGYMRKFKYFYGGEHSEYSDRALRTQGYAINFYPVFAQSTAFIKLQDNDFHAYDVNLDEVYGKNLGELDGEMRPKILRGVDLLNPQSGLNKELVVLQTAPTTKEQIIAALSKKKGKKRK